MGVSSALFWLTLFSFLLVLPPSNASAKDRRPIAVVVYDGIGTTKRARFAARVLVDKGLDSPAAKESKWRRLRRSFRVFESDEIAGAQVEFQISGRRWLATSDKEGLVSIAVEGVAPGEHRLQAKLIAPASRRWRSLDGRLHVVDADQPGIAVISDVDDTVLKSSVGNKLRLLVKTATGSARTMRAFAGAPALYRRLAARYPLIYVSGSPINLYTRLQRFFVAAGLPRGPLLLKSLGIGADADSLTKQRSYKLRRLREVLALLPSCRFILIGDSGEQDPEIYRALSQAEPKRVAAVLIHNVNNAAPKAPRFAGQLLFGQFAEAQRYLLSSGYLAADEVAK